MLVINIFVLTFFFQNFFFNIFFLKFLFEFFFSQGFTFDAFPFTETKRTLYVSVMKNMICSKRSQLNFRLL